MDNQFGYIATESLAPSQTNPFSAANIISHLEPNHKKFNYFDLHAHQLIEPLDILTAPAH
ncbi:hypothetical protein [Motilimonas sp. KMU-193]|uniref:hypothetical protein n=1 Tax=Motilimonas sp. KMU-193 TaxID=3388668 RepID=UPI00396B2C0B